MHEASYETPGVLNSRRTTTFRRDGRVVEGARLESVFRGNSNEGSNPSLSASFHRPASGNEFQSVILTSSPGNATFANGQLVLIHSRTLASSIGCKFSLAPRSVI